MRAEEPAAADDVHGGRAARVFARAVVFLRYLVPVAWVAAAVAVYSYGPTISQLPTSDVDALLPDDLPAQAAEARASEIFGSSLLPRIVVVQREPDGLTLAEQRRVVEQALRLNRGRLPGFPAGSIAVPYVNTLESFPAAREQGTTALTYLAFPSDVGAARQRNLAVRYADALEARTVPAHVTGFIAGNLQASQTVNDNLGLVELVTIGIVAAILGLYLRSLLAPVVTLAAAGIAWILATRAVAYVGIRAGIPVPDEVEPIIAVLLLGVVTDYSVFFLAGSRMRMLEGDAPRDAVRRTTTQYIPIVTTAALLVAFGLATLRVASIGFVQALGPAMAVVVVVSMVVAATLVPASLAIFGRAVFWPGLRESRRAWGRRLRAWVVRMLTKKPIAALAAVLLAAALVAGSLGLADTRLGLTPISQLPSGTGVAQGADDAAAGFAGGVISLTEVVVSEPGIVDDSARLRRLGRLIADVPGVAAAFGAGDMPVQGLQRFFRAPGANAVRYLVALESHPYGARAIDEYERLRDRMPRLLERAGLQGAEVAYAGDTAIAAETVGAIRHDIAWVTLAAFAVNFVLLALFLRALVAPLLLVAASALGLAATFGITTYVFQDQLGVEQLTYYVPLAVGVLLLSFGSDYNLFVVGRIWQEAGRRSVRDAVRYAAPRASRAISVAGVALALSFAALALVPLQPFREFAFAMAVGILIDTFVVRTYLVPALIALFGRTSWWPSGRGERVAAPERP